MITTEHINSHDAYGRSGPHGSHFWHSLARLKSLVTHGILCSWQKEQKVEKNIKIIAEFLHAEISRINTQLTDPKSSLRQKLQSGFVNKSWEVDFDIESQNMRIKQLSSYLTDSYEKLNESIHYLHKGDERNYIYRLGLALMDFIWPYYFVRKQNHLITWLPSMYLLSQSLYTNHFEELVWEKKEGGHLYPSISNVLNDGEGSVVKEILHQSLKTGYWPDKWYQNHKDNQNIGHNQFFSPLKSDNFFDYEKDLLIQAPKESKFSDAFYLNQEALYVDDIENDSIVGRVIMCSPISGLLELLIDPEQPKEHSLAEIIKYSWQKIDSRNELRSDLNLVEKELEDQRVSVAETAIAFVNHNAVNKMLKENPAPKDECGSSVYLAQADIKAAHSLVSGKSNMLDSKDSIDSLTDYCSKRRIDLQIDGNHPKQIDSCFVSLIGELCYNAFKHGFDEEESQLKIHFTNDSKCKFSLETEVSFDDFKNIVRAIIKKPKHKGLTFMLELSKLLDINRQVPLFWKFKRKKNYEIRDLKLHESEIIWIDSEIEKQTELDQQIVLEIYSNHLTIM